MTRFFRRAPRLALLHGWIFALLLLPRTADAHTRLLRSDPAQGSALAGRPVAIKLWFSERPQLPFTHITLVDASGRAVELGPPEPLPSHGVAVRVMADVPPGRYTIRWQTGGADGHPTRGEIAFSVAASPRDTVAPAPLTLSTRPDTAEPAAAAPGVRASNAVVDVAGPGEPAPQKKWVAMRWVELVSMLVVLGAIGFRLAVLRRVGGAGVDDASDAARRYAQPALVLLVIAALARLAAELVAMHGASAYDAATVHATLTQTTWGRGWLVGMAGAFLAALGLALASRRMAAAWGIAALGGVLLALGAALTGHAMATDRAWLAVPLDALHVLGAGTWLGGVTMLALVGIPCARRAADGWEAVRRLVAAFNPLAIGMATLVVVTGLGSAWLRLGAVAALWESAYGRMLLVKLAVVAIVAAVGFYNWRRVTPMLGDERGTTRMRRGASTEALCAAVVLAITAVLIMTPLPEPRTPPSGVPTASRP